MDREPGCGDNSCVFSVIRNNGGMRTNGGCRCFKNLEMNCEIWGAATATRIPYDNREELKHLRRSVQLLARAYKEIKDQIYVFQSTHDIKGNK